MARNKWGGHRQNAGRKSKDEERRAIERLAPHAEEVTDKLVEKAKEGEPWAVKLFFYYLYGKPTEHVAIEQDPPQEIRVLYFGPEGDKKEET